MAFDSKQGYSDRPLVLSCGQCVGCRLERSRQWALRCVHEAQLHERNSFVTLTYAPEHVPRDGSLDVRHWQLFAKRLRKRVGSFRFLHCGEYGEENFRPHYHACLFGVDFGFDRQLFSRQGDNEVFTSKTLEDLWGLGFATVGHLTWQSAAYVARYVMKKATGKQAQEQYRRIDLETGEEYHVRPEYVTMSRRPGLATEWFRRFKSDVFPDDHVVHDGKVHRPPKFYDSLLEKDGPEGQALLQSLKAKRARAAQEHQEHLTERRLRVREQVQKRKLERLSREL